MPDFSSLVSMLNLRLGTLFALFLACAAIVFGPEMGLEFLAKIDATFAQWARIGLVVFGALTFVAVLSALWQGVKTVLRQGARIVYAPIGRWRAKSARLRDARNSLNDLTSDEYVILAYLVTRGEPHFEAPWNGGLAAGLLHRQLIRRRYRSYRMTTPFSVDEFVWRALHERKDDFVHPDPHGLPPYC